MRKFNARAILILFCIVVLPLSCIFGSQQEENQATTTINNIPMPTPELTDILQTPIVPTPTPAVPIPTLTEPPILTSTPIPEPVNTASGNEQSSPIVTGDLMSLQATLEQEVANYPYFEISVCVTDLEDGAIICIDGDRQRDTGCVIDLFALFVAVEEFQAGRATPDDYISDVGTSLAVQIRAGIGASSPDNVAIFLAAVKGGSLAQGTYRAREIVGELGLQNTIFGYVPYNPVEVDSPPNLTTAWDINKTLMKLWRGEIFSPEWTSYTISVLTDSPRYTNSMPNKVQWKGAQVAHKVGYFGYESGYDFAVWNDVGIVYWQKDGRQRAFALSVFTKGPWAGKSIVASLADIAFDYFNAK